MSGSKKDDAEAAAKVQKGLLFQKLVARLPEGEREVEVAWDGHSYLTRTPAGAAVLTWDELDCGRTLVTVDGRPLEVRISPAQDGAARIEWRGRHVVIRVEDDISHRARLAHAHAGGPVALRSPMPGTVIRVLVEEGETVELEQPVCIVEAMKMQNELPAPIAGKVLKVAVAPGDAVDGDQILLEIETGQTPAE